MPINRSSQSPIEALITTNTIPFKGPAGKTTKDFYVVSAAPLFAQTIRAMLKEVIKRVLYRFNTGGYMKLNVTKRTAGKKSETKQLRRAGHIPAIIYSRGKETADNVALKSFEFNVILRQIQPGRLSTQIFTLVDEKGKQRRALVKRNPVSRDKI